MHKISFITLVSIISLFSSCAGNGEGGEGGGGDEPIHITLDNLDSIFLYSNEFNAKQNENFIFNYSYLAYPDPFSEFAESAHTFGIHNSNDLEGALIDFAKENTISILYNETQLTKSTYDNYSDWLAKVEEEDPEVDNTYIYADLELFNNNDEGNKVLCYCHYDCERTDTIEIKVQFNDNYESIVAMAFPYTYK